MDATTRALRRRQLADRLAHIRLLQDRGELAPALIAVEQLLRIAAEAEFGGATVWTARRIRAELVFDLGDTTQARRLATALYEQLATTLPPRHPAIIRIAVLLAGICHEQGELSTAERLCHQALGSQPQPESNARPARRTPARRALLLAEVHLALITADHGDTPAAIDQLDRTLRQLQDQYGDQDLDTIRIRAHLAELHTVTGHREQARRLLVRALHDACARYGPAHPVSIRLDRMLVAVEPPMPATDETDRQTSEPVGWQARKHKHTTTAPTSDTAPTATARPDQPEPLASDVCQPGRIWGRHRPPAAARVPGRRRPTRRYLARAAWPLATIVALATAGIGLQALRQPSPPANAQSPSLSVKANPVATNLTIRRGAGAGQIVITWSDTSHGAATPILSITDSTGQAIAVATLRPGTQRYQRDHLNPHASYCVMLGLFSTPGDTAALGQQVCLPNS